MSSNLRGCSLSYLLCVSSILMLILGDGLALSFVSLIAVMFLLQYIINDGRFLLLCL